MPVITQASLPEVRMPYVVIGFVVLCCMGIWMRRQEKRATRIRLEEGSRRWPGPGPMQQIVEKERMYFEHQNMNAASQLPHGRYRPGSHLIPRPPQPPPFTPPTILRDEKMDTSTEIPLSNASYYDTNELFEDPPMYFEPASFAASDPLVFESPNEFEFGIPRRRSYTKTTNGGTMDVSGEIVIGEGWRRHTRVFGGGVCLACEESESRRNTS